MHRTKSQIGTCVQLKGSGNFNGVSGAERSRRGWFHSPHNFLTPVHQQTLLPTTVAGNGQCSSTNEPSLAPTNDYYRTRLVP